MSMLEHVSQKTFVKDNKHTDLKPHVPSVATIATYKPPVPSPSNGSSSPKGESIIFKHFKGLFSICQSNKDTMDSIHARHDVILQNQRNLHKKNQIEDSFVEFEVEDKIPQLLDPFASLTTAELEYFAMVVPSSPLSTRARRKSASIARPTDDDESSGDEYQQKYDEG
jgi:hypothetical protein